jgi:hypothetical protein
LKNSDNIDWNAIRSVKDLFARRIFRGKVSGKDTRSRPEPEKAIDALPTKSVLVLADWDRAARSLMNASTSQKGSTSVASTSRFSIALVST